jgi:hypothetical protein
LKKYLLILIICAILPEMVFPQGSCCGGMGTTGTRFGLGTANAKSLQLQLAYDFNYMNEIYDGDIRLENEGTQRVVHTGILEVNYGISRRFSVAGIISYMGQEIGSTTLDGIRQIEYFRGFGDMVIMAKMRITNPLAYNGWGLYAGIGPKIPTGSHNNTKADGSLYTMDLQLGTGSWDAITWLSLSKSHLFIKNLYLNSGVTFRLSGNNRNFRDSLTYKSGNEFQFTGGLSYNLYSKVVFDFFGYLRYRYQDMDRLSGEPVDNCGGHWLFISPGVKANFTQNFSFIFLTDLPLYQNIRGPQLTTTYRFSAGLIYNFESRNSVEIGPGQ